MKSRNIKRDLPLYSDNLLSSDRNAEIEAHLLGCPLCREVAAGHRSLRIDLSSLRRPAIPAAAIASIQNAARAAAVTGAPAMFDFYSHGERRLRTRIIPVLVGVATSLMVGIGLLNILVHGSRVDASTRVVADGGPRHSRIMLSKDLAPVSAGGSLSASDYAGSRLSVADQSPSINPNGALVALAKSLVREHGKDDEMVVVANVFGNGLAEITEVVEPAHDTSAIAELQQAFDSDTGDSPFVPASVDGRSDNVQVVLKFKSVNVNTRLSRSRR